LAAALALLLVFEGILSFLVPHRYRAYRLEVACLPTGSLRRLGLIAAVLGLALLTRVHGWSMAR